MRLTITSGGHFCDFLFRDPEKAVEAFVCGSHCRRIFLPQTYTSVSI